MGKADFVKIANSMSATADLSPVELPISPRPNMQVAPPSFKVLRPTSLPNGLQPQERTIPAPSHTGSGVIITYAQVGDSMGMNSLILVEMPVAAASDLPNDPKASKEQIAGHEVSVSRDKNTCEMMTWQQDGVYFALINPVISSMPSQYTYEQMRTLVESLKLAGKLDWS
jgi:hypothetical protein